VKSEAMRLALRVNPDADKLSVEDRSVYDWYRFVPSFPPHLVRDYLKRFAITEKHCLLDPFRGTGITIVESKEAGLLSVGIEANPMIASASRVECDLTIHPAGLGKHSGKVPEIAEDKIDAKEAELALSAEAQKILLKGSISEKPLKNALEASLNEASEPEFKGHELLALAKTPVHTASNLNFGPEVGVGKRKKDAPVLFGWFENLRTMGPDISNLKDRVGARSHVLKGDSRETINEPQPKSINAVITPPLCPNENDYTRATRLESVILGLINNRKALQYLKRELIQSNTRNIYKDDACDAHIDNFPQVSIHANKIEARRVDLNKTRRFEPLCANVTKQYFGGMVRHLANVRQALAPGACLARLVGDQASFFRIMIKTGELLSRIAVSLCYELIGIDLFRTRLSTAARSRLRKKSHFCRGQSDSNPSSWILVCT